MPSSQPWAGWTNPQWFYNLAGVCALASLHLPLPALRSWPPDGLALQLNPAETKDGSVGFPCINSELKIKLWALIREPLSWLPSSFAGPSYFIPNLPFRYTQFSVAAGQLQLRSWIFIIFSTHDNIMLLPREVLKMCLKIIMTWCWDNQKGGHTTRLSLITFL